MAAIPVFAVPGYQFDVFPDLSRQETRERLSHSAIEGFFAILGKWHVSAEQGGALLGGMARSSVYNLKRTARTLTQDELMRISYIVGIFKALHILLPDALADEWPTRPNDNPLFRGHTPLQYVLWQGIPGLRDVRNLLDAARGGQ